MLKRCLEDSIYSAKSISTPLASHFKFYKNSLNTEEEKDKVPYASIVDNLMYVMASTRPNIAQVVGVVSRFMSNPKGCIGKQLSGS